jgi:hypothetical protein
MLPFALREAVTDKRHQTRGVRRAAAALLTRGSGVRIPGARGWVVVPCAGVVDAACALVVAGSVGDEMIVVPVPVLVSSFAGADVAAGPRTATVYPLLRALDEMKKQRGERLSLAKMQRAATKLGGRCLSNKYVTLRTPMR